MTDSRKRARQVALGITTGVWHMTRDDRKTGVDPFTDPSKAHRTPFDGDDGWSNYQFRNCMYVIWTASVLFTLGMFLWAAVKHGWLF